MFVHIVPCKRDCFYCFDFTIFCRFKEDPFAGLALFASKKKFGEMEGETSWVSHSADIEARVELDTFSESNDETGSAEDSAVSMDLVLPDDLLERILAHLPVASVIRAGSVCRRWNEIVTSKRFLWNSSQVLQQKPWYFMFTDSDGPFGHAYDPNLRKWHAIDLPRIGSSNWFVASSCGLVCFMDNDSRTKLYVCNPITRWCRGLDGPPGPKSPDYSALAVWADRSACSYKVLVVMSKQVPDNFYQWDLSIHMYDSDLAEWAIDRAETLMGWRAGDESVICDRVLYFLIYSTVVSGPGGSGIRHGLIMHDLKIRAPRDGLLIRSFVPVPCSLTCGRLMNLKEKLVMVGGIGKQDRPDIIKGIGIWVLEGREWREMARMPHKYFQGFGEFDDVFASSGTDGLIYIQSYGATALLVFDVSLKQWKWAQKCPVTKRFPLQLFTGFCFEPRLEIAP